MADSRPVKEVAIAKVVHNPPLVRPGWTTLSGWCILTYGMAICIGRGVILFSRDFGLAAQWKLVTDSDGAGRFSWLDRANWLSDWLTMMLLPLLGVFLLRHWARARLIAVLLLLTVFVETAISVVEEQANYARYPSLCDLPFRVGRFLIALAPVTFAVMLVLFVSTGKRRKVLEGCETLLCENCLYDLRGSPGDRCPECGMVWGRAAADVDKLTGE